ncbi:MAG TPA: NAD-dependent epimerase/dehydratase family protein [Candidatus Limiplasma sp.]|mgnify:CR=1 FL=1|nr:NAD-dependent epimerase/dehydratase family protein [Candidatus Limiplasma sp.]HPS80321.1 NAD-dependent epimerase/dehydratase family protein [Candidatus Limiplasma sp.]
MRNEYLVTGAAGHLGLTVVQALLARGETVRAFVLPADEHAPQLPAGISVYAGDVLRPETLAPAFATDADTALTVIHCAAIVTIASGYQPMVHAVNVEGVKNVVEQCLKHAVRKLVYVSSVHALPALPKGEIIRETERFDPERVDGLYAKTKAEATAYVLEAASKQGLNASVVHPSGICGPNDYSHGHLTQLVCDWHDGRLAAGIRGGYDFVDVRDVANAILACCDRGKKGECYLLTNRYISVEEIFGTLHELGGRKSIRTFLPLWFIRLVAPFAELYYRLMRQKPLFTRYSIDTLQSNAAFCHDKAAKELGFSPRPFRETLKDTLDWCAAAGLFRKP